MKPLSHLTQISKEEWRDKASTLIKRSRLWLQEKPELGFITAFFIGIFIATFFKLTVGLAAVGVIVSFLVYHFAPDEQTSPYASTSAVSQKNNCEDKSRGDQKEEE